MVAFRFNPAKVMSPMFSFIPPSLQKLEVISITLCISFQQSHGILNIKIPVKEYFQVIRLSETGPYRTSQATKIPKVRDPLKEEAVAKTAKDTDSSDRCSFQDEDLSTSKEQNHESDTLAQAKDCTEKPDAPYRIEGDEMKAVSYTHLTLPTIYSV